MDELAQSGADEGRKLFHYFLGRHDAPSFARRAREVEGAWRQLLETCRLKRDSLLEMVKLRLATLRARLESWSDLAALVSEADVALLAQLEDDLQPRLRLAVERCSAIAVWRAALIELVESIERFNRLWAEETRTLDLRTINDLRDGYNRYYLVEKECALGSARLARHGFQRLPPVTSQDILTAVPPLPVPRVHG